MNEPVDTTSDINSIILILHLYAHPNILILRSKKLPLHFFIFSFTLQAPREVPLQSI